MWTHAASQCKWLRIPTIIGECLFLESKQDES